MNAKEIREGLQKAGYLASDDIAYAVGGTLEQNIPLLVEGDPGVGKTCLAKAVAKMTGAPLIRVQFYEGVTADRILYDFDYERQLITIEAMRGTLEKELAGRSIEEALAITGKINFYSRDFLIERPVLRALDSTERCVLLLDEVDKASEEIEYTLLEVLDEYAITIPQLGTITCPPERRPYIFLTSNRYRELSDATKRRCSYLYIRRKSAEQMKQILMMDEAISEAVAAWAAERITQLQRLPLGKQPSIPEARAWVRNILSAGGSPQDALFLLSKTPEDADRIRASGILAGNIPEAATW